EVVNHASEVKKPATPNPIITWFNSVTKKETPHAPEVKKVEAPVVKLVEVKKPVTPNPIITWFNSVTKKEVSKVEAPKKVETPVIKPVSEINKSFEKVSSFFKKLVEEPKKELPHAPEIKKTEAPIVKPVIEVKKPEQKQIERFKSFFKKLVEEPKKETPIATEVKKAEAPIIKPVAEIKKPEQGVVTETHAPEVIKQAPEAHFEAPRRAEVAKQVTQHPVEIPRVVEVRKPIPQVRAHVPQPVEVQKTTPEPKTISSRINTKRIWEQMKFFFGQLSSEPRVGGLHLSDSALIYSDIFGGLKTSGVRLTPGIIVGGKIVDGNQFRVALKQLHLAIDPSGRKTIPVSVALPASGIYTQSFTTPNVGRERLNESALLNLQMISPMSTDTYYMSWQLLQETPDQFELLGAFADKKAVDEFRAPLEESLFSPVAFEFPSLALSRLIGLMGRGDSHPAILLQISGDGLNFSILRNNGLYFDYFRSWNSIQEGERQITREKLEEVVTTEVQKVMNFTVSKFKESPARLFLVAPGFEKDMQDFIKGHFGIPVAVLKITTWDVSSQWYVAIGSALRTSEEGKNEFLINLASEELGKFFYREQTLNFIRLWRGILVGVFALFFILFAGSSYSLARELESVNSGFSIFTANSSLAELQKLEGEVRVFNSFVSNMRSVKSVASAWPTLFKKVSNVSSANGITIDKLDSPSIRDMITLVAHAPTREKIIDFKNALSADTSNFSNVDLLVSQISTKEDGSSMFNITFRFIGVAPAN
ncbi:MAG: hypothetical protein WCO21_03360, partial [bacterium]